MLHAPETNPKKILLVDDDPDLLKLARFLLQEEGYKVYIAESGEEALKLLSRYGLPHLALVDYHMPGINGFTFARKSREYGEFPIIMVTAEDDTEKVIESLAEFADDYIVKPFTFPELLARVERALRRIKSFAYTQQQQSAQISEALAVDFAHREAMIDGDAVSLTPTENEILYILMSNAGRTVTTNVLLNSLWPDEDATEERLHVHIHRLRRKIEADARAPRYILSDRGEGYRFEKS